MKILVRATNWVGDAVMSIPALEALRRCWPEAETSILARPWVADIYRGQPYVGRVLVFERSGAHKGILGGERLARELRRERFDLALLLQNAFEAAWMVWRAGIPERIGYARDARGWLLTRAVPVPRAGEAPPHETYYYLELLRRIGWLDRLPPPADVRFPIAIPAETEARFADQLAANSLAEYFVLSPGGGWAGKRWPAENFGELYRRLAERYGWRGIVNFAPGERELAESVAQAAAPSQPLLLEMNLPQLLAALRRAKFFVGADTGPLHLAVAAGTPVIGLYGPTDPARTGPFCAKDVVVRNAAANETSYKHLDRYSRAMLSISVEQVLDAVERRLRA